MFFEQISRIDKLFRLNKENKGLKQNYKWEKLSKFGEKPPNNEFNDDFLDITLKRREQNREFFYDENT